ncbi:sensor histidine kinase [Pontibacillus marinus]|uniref:Sensor histidine kinase n=1 Tax=Pontibacillus marinus BH030004 = DSM 16465 TaxID=1385511 RepID=A0A0A5G3Y4_9BACI|nr:sensor histidine kinase [Pontibacillus marinus]KGX85800.1 histidine kinase [Pontibacillus marinus BH030004 = DSM 16465]
MMLRQALAGLLFSFVLTSFLLAGTFLTFPLEQFSDIWKKETFDIPYWLFVISVSLGGGLIGGAIYGWFWRNRIYKISYRLDELIKGQKLSNDMGESYHEFFYLQEQLQKLESKLKQQAELSQKLATERAHEREQSLQEVVIQERNRLARELHDSVSQQLFAASMMMSAVNDSNEAKNTAIQKQLDMVEKMIQQSQLEMRALLLHLRPAALKGKSLREGMEELLVELTQKVPIEIDWKIEDLNVDKGIEDQLFRILQEAVSNTLRHAKANSLNAMLIERDDMVIMRVMDDGVGFNMEEEKTSSYGLQNMNERALEVGGTLKVVSVKNQGTRLEVKIPYRAKDGEQDD